MSDWMMATFTGLLLVGLLVGDWLYDRRERRRNATVDTERR